MYIIKISFPVQEAFPVATLIDSRLTGSTEAKTYSLVAETEQVEYSLGYAVNPGSFCFGIARKLAEQFLGSVGSNLRYQYTDRFLPDATFVFEYGD